jgi:pantoate--beta-alanine ligase
MQLQVFRHIAPLRHQLNAERDTGKRIAIVPTMGNLHEGHLQLIRRAHDEADVVVATIFVNRLQFGLNEDWDQYPRTFEADCAKLDQEKCHYLFFPEETEMYPNGMDQQTRVICPAMTDILCGASRPGHFEGVTTVVTKLFNIVEPDVAIFGQKDYQQLAIIRRMVADLCIDVELVGAPVARDTDGLALSSRNAFIDEDERPYANQLYKTLCWMRDRIISGERDYRDLEAQAKKQINAVGFRVDYLSVCNAQNLDLAVDDDRNLAILGALFTAHARLIDNLTLDLDKEPG